jgi:hypothetical protein
METGRGFGLYQNKNKNQNKNQNQNPNPNPDWLANRDFNLERSGKINKFWVGSFGIRENPTRRNAVTLRVK